MTPHQSLGIPCRSLIWLTPYWFRLFAFHLLRDIRSTELLYSLDDSLVILLAFLDSTVQSFDLLGL